MIMRKLLCAAGGAALAALANMAIAQADPATTTLPVVSSATEASHVICAAECSIRSLYVTIAGTTSGFIMTFNQATVPADGVVAPRDCVYIAGPNTVSMEREGTIDAFSLGLVAVFSTGADCFHKTASASAFFRAALH